jgi:hypothetical protein
LSDSDICAVLGFRVREEEKKKVEVEVKVERFRVWPAG